MTCVTTWVPGAVCNGFTHIDCGVVITVNVENVHHLIDTEKRKKQKISPRDENT